MNDKVVPFVLRNRRKLAAEPLPKNGEAYDLRRQVWINKFLNRPLVERDSAQVTSQFGETTLTKTSEGRDQIEVSSSTFGETSVTRSVEGSDQSENASWVHSSQFGETLLTATGEGSDRSEGVSSASQFGETSLTESGEGADRSEKSDVVIEGQRVFRSDGEFVYLERC